MAGLTKAVIELAFASGGGFERLPLKAPLRLWGGRRAILTPRR